jgi:ABC-2 type transport system permease protein
MKVVGGLRLYGRYLGISVRGQMQYRSSFVMLSIGHFLVTGIEFATIWILFDRFGSLEGWTIAEVGLFYGMINTAFALSDAASRGFDLFGGMVKHGDFDRVLLRPRSAALQVAGQELTLRRVGRLAQGLLVLSWSAARLGVAWTAGRMLLVAATIASAACLFFGIIVLQATAAFWTVETLEMFNCLTYGGVQTTQYPIAIYRTWFRKFFTYVVPLAAVSYFPGLAVLGKADPLGTGRLFQCLSPLAGPAFLGLSLLVWRIGVRHYQSTGS